jgi:hypothetical protein
MNLNTASEGLSALGPIIKDIKFLGKINEYNFENFLRLYRNKDNQFHYNLLSNAIHIDTELDVSTYYEIRLQKSVPWTTLSYNEYRTMHLWWLIMEVNKIQNPLDYPVPGTVLKILYPTYVKTIINSIYDKVINS